MPDNLDETLLGCNEYREDSEDSEDDVRLPPSPTFGGADGSGTDSARYDINGIGALYCKRCYTMFLDVLAHRPDPPEFVQNLKEDGSIEKVLQLQAPRIQPSNNEPPVPYEEGKFFPTTEPRLEKCMVWTQGPDIIHHLVAEGTNSKGSGTESDVEMTLSEQRAKAHELLAGEKKFWAKGVEHFIKVIQAQLEFNSKQFEPEGAK